MMRLAEAILAGGERDGRRILSVASVTTLLTEHQIKAGSSPERDELNAPDVRHGIAFFVAHDKGRLYYEHSGDGPGWNALMRIYPRERLASVIMGNGTVIPADDLADSIATSAPSLRRSR